MTYDGLRKLIEQAKDIPGAIRNKAAYALGKMLDNSGWHGKLRNGITPADIDVGFDDNGAVIFIELSSATSDWKEIPFGQRKFYMSAAGQRENCCAVVAYHSVVPLDGREIDTREDIESFQIMRWSKANGRFMIGDQIHGNDKWKQFIEGWFSNGYVWAFANFMADK